MKAIRELVNEAGALLEAMEKAQYESHTMARKLEWTLRKAHAQALRHERRLCGEKEPKQGD